MLQINDVVYLKIVHSQTRKLLKKNPGIIIQAKQPLKRYELVEISWPSGTGQHYPDELVSESDLIHKL